VPAEGDLYCTLDDLAHCSGLALGSPTRFGNMASEMKYFWDQTTSLWLNGALWQACVCIYCIGFYAWWSGKYSVDHASAFISSRYDDFGLTNSIAALSNTKTGGTPYASHVSGPRHDQELSQDEKICEAMGKRWLKLR
jgi:NAD(P)H dehydrogenase (quinone)